jgi:serine protease SohB
MELLIGLLTFFLKAVIIVASILIVLSSIMAIASKAKDSSRLKIKKMNDELSNLRDALQSKILSKKEYKQYKKSEKKNKKTEASEKNKVFVLNFNGDIKASANEHFREEITALLSVATPKDEVFIRLESGGGMVHAYGLAASQLMRIKQHRIPLTIAIDKVAASGGYMMACVADKIIAAPFAIIGSIGAVMQIPNFHRWLKKHNIDLEQLTAGEFKRTLTLFGENTDKDRAKVQQELDDTHLLFKDFITENRPCVDITKVATGEHWYGTRALERQLIDNIQTSDDYLFEANKNKAIYRIHHLSKKSRLERMLKQAALCLKQQFFSCY